MRYFENVFENRFVLILGILFPILSENKSMEGRYEIISLEAFLFILQLR